MNLLSIAITAFIVLESLNVIILYLLRPLKKEMELVFLMPMKNLKTF